MHAYALCLSHCGWALFNEDHDHCTILVLGLVVWMEQLAMASERASSFIVLVCDSTFVPFLFLYRHEGIWTAKDIYDIYE